MIGAGGFKILKVTLCCVFLMVLIKTGLCEQCSSAIYCQGRILDTVQMSKIFPDSKTFVDMKMKYQPNVTLERFDQFIASFNGTKPARADIKRFVTENFDPVGDEFQNWIPSDWKSHPKFLAKIKDEDLKKWGHKLNNIWKKLGRQMKQEVKENPELHSLIWIPNPTIVPGGRFREIYYWDSYWIVQGLLLSEMHQTVKGMLENFLYFVDKIGHIPNGGRVYYMARSQPPLLMPMVKLYLDYTNDLEFVQENLHLMEMEFDYWLTNHLKNVSVNGIDYKLAVYGGDNFSGPRSESYSEDAETAMVFKDDLQKEEFYSEIRAAAESGMDFSSRWFIKNATNQGNLTDIRTRSIVPVDLNSIIYWNAALLTEFHRLLNNHGKAEKYNQIASEWMKAVTDVLWNENAGVWLDYDLQNQIHRNYFYPTNIAPLWTGCYYSTNKDEITKKVVRYLKKENVLLLGGVPTSLEHTGEQWDYPNAWPPLQHMMIVGLNSTGDDDAARYAYQLAENWVRSNYKAFKETGAMFEKYDATKPGQHGGGGEYEPQLGFGWTNGVILDLLHRYAENLTVYDPATVLQPTTPDISTNKPETMLQNLSVELVDDKQVIIQSSSQVSSKGAVAQNNAQETSSVENSLSTENTTQAISGEKQGATCHLSSMGIDLILAALLASFVLLLISFVVIGILICKMRSSNNRSTTLTAEERKAFNTRYSEILNNKPWYSHYSQELKEDEIFDAV